MGRALDMFLNSCQVGLGREHFCPCVCDIPHMYINTMSCPCRSTVTIFIEEEDTIIVEMLYIGQYKKGCRNIIGLLIYRLIIKNLLMTLVDTVLVHVHVVPSFVQ